MRCIHIRITEKYCQQSFRAECVLQKMSSYKTIQIIIKLIIGQIFGI
jgi:hypothetical protein